MAGKFIVIEGLDGAGKTTHAKRLTEYLTEKGVEVVRHAEPTDGVYGRACREALGGKDCPKTQLAMLFTMDRIDHNLRPDDGIEALLAAGKTVLCDRYYYSTLAYQGLDVGPEWLADLNLKCPDIRKPDLCIFMDLAPEVSMARIRKSREDSQIEIYENLESLTRIRERFYEVFQSMPDENIAAVDCDADKDTVQARVRAVVDPLYD